MSRVTTWKDRLEDLEYLQILRGYKYKWYEVIMIHREPDVLKELEAKKMFLQRTVKADTGEKFGIYQNYLKQIVAVPIR